MVRLGNSTSQYPLAKQLPSPRSTLPRLPPLQTSRSPKPAELKGLARYTLWRTLGTGSFARVKLALDKVTTEVVAVKVMSKGLVVRRKQLGHVLEERRLLACLQHPFIVGLRQAFQDQFFLYLVLEYVQGGELYGLLAQQGCIEPYDAKVYTCEVFSALVYLHSRHIAYRDLKPENLLLTSSGHIKLADLGFAKVIVEKSYTLCGTPQYLAPEIINREGHDERCDWWALGVLLYEMLTGKTPFEADSPYELYEQILTEDVKLPSKLPINTRNLLERLLVKDSKERASEEEIRNSAYFAGANWDQVEQCRLLPHYRPRVKNPFDASHFDKYPEANLPLDAKILTEMTLFAEF